MTRLSVNVNKLATLRNAREKNLPDVVRLADHILRLGAHGITVHPRPDGRHIRRDDVFALKALLDRHPDREFNIEGYPNPDFLELIATIRPHQTTLVPDPPDVLTSNAGWDLVAQAELLTQVTRRLQTAGTRVSLFVDPFRFDDEQLTILRNIGADRIELYTERYAEDFTTPMRDATTATYARVAQLAVTAGIAVNAGHDLNQENLGHLCARIPALAEVSIGHALICEALEQGLPTTIGHYLRILANHGN